jgi:hypothetical protein
MTTLKVACNLTTFHNHRNTPKNINCIPRPLFPLFFDQCDIGKSYVYCTILDLTEQKSEYMTLDATFKDLLEKVYQVEGFWDKQL